MHISKPRILILGSDDHLGKRIAEMLAKNSGWKILASGTHLNKLNDLYTEIKQKNPAADFEIYPLDWNAEDFFAHLKNSQANLVIHSVGPFSPSDYKIARACIALKMHYLDLAVNREFVIQITHLDESAKKQGVSVISGASPVSALSCAVVDKYASKFAILREINFGMVPGNKAEQGQTNMATLLETIGKPFQRLEGGSWKTVYGWQNLHQHYYGDNLGLRWHANCDIPDLALFPTRYPMLKTVVFHSGLEVYPLHLLLWHMSWLVRAHIVKTWAPLHRSLSALSKWFKSSGTDRSGMYVRLRGSSHHYQPLEVNWTLVAESGHEPYIAAITSTLLIEKILQGNILPGAQPCLGMFTLEEFDEAAKWWDIYHTVIEKEI